MDDSRLPAIWEDRSAFELLNDDAGNRVMCRAVALWHGCHDTGDSLCVGKAFEFRLRDGSLLLLRLDRKSLAAVHRASREGDEERRAAEEDEQLWRGIIKQHGLGSEAGRAAAYMLKFRHGIDVQTSVHSDNSPDTSPPGSAVHPPG